MFVGKKYEYVTVRIDEETKAALDKRIEYLQETWGVHKVTKSDAIRHAIMKTGYSRSKKNGRSDDDMDF